MRLFSALFLALTLFVTAAAPSLAKQEEDPAEAAQPGAAPASQTAQNPLVALISSLDQATKYDLFTFIAGNTYLTLQRQSADAIMTLLSLNPGPDRDKTEDALAAVQMSRFSNPQLDVLVANGLIGLFALQDLADQDPAAPDLAPDDPLRNRRFLCLVSGSNMDVFADLALDLGFPQENIDACPGAFQQATALWQGLTLPHRAGRGGEPLNAQADGGQTRIRVVFQDAERDPLSLFIRESGVMQTLSDQLERSYLLPDGLTLNLRACGQRRSYFDAQSGSLVVCEELVQAYARAYVALFLQDPDPAPAPDTDTDTEPAYETAPDAREEDGRQPE